MANPALTDRSSDAELWRMTCLGNAEAFEAVVRRYQSMVCSVAYNFCGDLALSEDVAQETFWTAWRERSALLDFSRLRPWLCGIARNLGRNAGRRAGRPANAAAALETVAEPAAEAPGPAEAAVSREQESLIWATLAEIPETYREPLILFYREDQSVSEVAAALELSEDAVKQRLSRGRSMLRERVADMVEEGLKKSRPGSKFTICVMTGLAASSAGAKTAVAAVGAGAAGAAAQAAGAGAAAGLAGGLLGSAGGLAGGWLGTWLPAQLAPTRREHDLIRQSGRRTFRASLLFMALLFPLIYFLVGSHVTGYLIALAVWFVVLQSYIGVETFVLIRALRRVRAEQDSLEPNETPLRKELIKTVSRYRGRVFQTRARLLGLPLIDINVRDPVSACEPGPPDGEADRRGVARGWVAIGDDARGVILAVGGLARGLIAIGGRTVGAVSVGGIAFGLVSVGGLSLGLLGIGGLGLGVYAGGGVAIGWQAAGGGAIAWDTAVGGMAVARHSAFGGAAIARDFAVGGGGSALHFNDDAAEAVVLNHPLKRGLDWSIANRTWVTAAIVVFSVAFPLALMPLMYQRIAENRDPDCTNPAIGEVNE